MSFILLLPQIIRHAFAGLAVLALLGLSGCSTIKLAYQQSDTVAYWWLDGYVDLQDTQKPFTREALAELQRWHRQTQLSDYAALLQRMQTLATQDITPVQACAVAEDMKTSVIQLLRHIEPTGAQLALQLSPAQWPNIQKRFDKNNADWRADWLTPSAAERLRYRSKQATQRLEDFYGNLAPPQQAALQQWLVSSPFDPALSEAERLRRQTDLLQTLQRIKALAPTNPASPDTKVAAPTDAAQALLRGFINRSLNSPNERLQSYQQALWQDNCEGFTKLHNSTTAAQRQHMVGVLRGYERDIKDLMQAKR